MDSPPPTHRTYIEHIDSSIEPTLAFLTHWIDILKQHLLSDTSHGILARWNTDQGFENIISFRLSSYLIVGLF